MKTIYCVEDDQNIRELTLYAITTAGFEATGMECAKELFRKLENSFPDLILLDIMLPDKDGMEILKELRSNPETRRIPVILVTAKSSELDKVKGLDSGADDYITKPFSVMELISRVKAVLRRTEIPEAETLAFRGIEVDYPRRKVTVDGREVVLTYKEFELLFYLLKNKGIALTRDRLMSEIWGFDFEGDCRTIDVHIRTLRQKLGDKGDVIETIRSVGYRVGLEE